MTNHQTLSQIVEIFGVVMQILILALLIWRRLALKFPALGLTMIFFLLRSSLNYSAQHYTAALKTLTPATWTKIILGFNIAEDALQAAIIVELALWLVPVLGAWRKRIWWQLAVGTAVVAGFVGVSLYELGYWPNAMTTAHNVPMRTLVLLDTHVALVALTAALVLLAALAVVAMAQAETPVTDVTPIQKLASRFALGWGVFGTVNLTGLSVGHYAMKTMNMNLWTGMQFTVIGSYVLMMLLWVVSLLMYRKQG